MKNKTSKKVPQAHNLNELVALLVNNFSPLHIYQFGLIENSASHFSVFTANEKQESKHYYLLMVIDSENKITNGVQDCVDQTFINNKATILVHGLASLKAALGAGSQFFYKAINGGALLYCEAQTEPLMAINLKTVEPDLQALVTFSNHKFLMANGYVQAAGACLEGANNNVCICLLYQAVEQSCLALIKIFLDYKPHSHHLGRLIDLIACAHTEFRDIFFNDAESECLFKLLCNSYAKGRYSDGFNVIDQDAGTLQEMVWGFVRLAKEFCECRLALNQ